MGEHLAASGVSTEKVARNGTRPAITFIANPHYGELESSSVAKAAEAIQVRRTLAKPSATLC